MKTNIDPVLEIVEKAKGVFAAQLQELATRGGLSKEMYVRYLSFQYHLTKGVQRHFLKLTAVLLPIFLVGYMELAEGMAQAAAQQSGSTYTPRSNYSSTTTSSGHTEYSTRKACNYCSGSGTCTGCRGAGRLSHMTCSSCYGSSNCFSCGGSGRSRY